MDIAIDVMKEIELKDCFESAIKDEKKGKKHKGLLITKPDDKKAEEYLNKAKKNLELCDLYKEKEIAKDSRRMVLHSLLLRSCYLV